MSTKFSVPTVKLEVAKLTDGRKVLAVTSPKSAEFVAGSRKLGGRWSESSKRWLFDLRDRARVEALLHACYGTTDSATAALCSLLITLPAEGHTLECRIGLAGRELARVYDRDGGAKIGVGVRVETGRMWSAGSKKNPALCWSAGTVLLVRDIPITAPREVDGCGDAIVTQLDEPSAATAPPAPPSVTAPPTDGARCWHVETRFADDAALCGSRWERHPSVDEIVARIQFAALCAAGLHVELHRLDPAPYGMPLETVVERFSPSTRITAVTFAETRPVQDPSDLANPTQDAARAVAP
jgi:hypothetical protein